jgi:hypothetical protein
MINLNCKNIKAQLPRFLRMTTAIALVTVGITQTASAVPSKLKRECKVDYKSLCPHYKIGTSKMRSCMRSNGRQLSWGCYQALKDFGYVSSQTDRRR